MNTTTSPPLKDTQAAIFMGLQTQTLRNWRTQSKGPPYIKIGRSVRYDINDLLEYMAKRRVQPEG
jgi:predicted DNA-binding transcriptional regulator AlpA